MDEVASESENWNWVNDKDREIVEKKLGTR